MSSQPTIVVEADPELVVEEQEVLIEVSPLPGPPGPPGAAEGFDEAMAAAAAAQATADTALSGLSGKQDASTAATDAELAAGLATRQATSEKGQPLGYAGLDGAGRISAAQLPNSVVELQGPWNASTNSPPLADGTGNPGDAYKVTTAGTRDLGSGSIVFKVNDTVMYGADGKWFRSRATDEVTSVAGKTGDVTLVPADIAAAAAVHSHTLAQITDAGAAAAKAVTTDTALGGNSDANLPTEKAVRGYVTTQAGLLIPTSAIETDATLPSNSDTKVPSSKAMKTALAAKADAANFLSAVKTADETVNNSSTLQDDDHLSISLTAGYWNFDLRLLLQAANTTADWQFQISFSGSMSGPSGYGAILSGANGVWGNVAAAQSPVALTGIGNAIVIGGGNFSGSQIQGLLIIGTLACNNTGTLKLQWAQNTANNSDSTVKQNSNMTARKL